jgi:hypothetical protein
MTFVCRQPAPPLVCTVALPGGAQLQGVNVLDQLQAALAPLAPVFVIVNCLTQIISVLQAAPSLLTDPGQFANALDALVTECVPNLAQLVPAVAFVQTAKDVLDCVISQLTDVRLKLLQLEALAAQLEGFRTYLESAEFPEQPTYGNVLECSEELHRRNYDSLSAQLAGLNQILALLRLLGVSVPGFPEIPNLSALQDAPLAEAIQALDDVTIALVNARALIP